MPQIPLYEGFQAKSSLLPLSPLSTTDMPDIAGSQSRMMGEALFDLGNAAQKIALQVKQEINETITRKNDREFAEGIRGVLHDPEKGFMTLLGLEAMTGREQAIGSLEKSYQTMEDHISDPDQRKMFSALASQRLETARLQIDIHAAEQTQVFRERETSASVTSHAMDAALNLDQWHQPASPYAMNKEAMLKSFDDLVRMRGYGEEQTKLQKQALLSSFHGDIVNRLVEQENPQQARAYLESYTGEIQPKQAEGLNRLVDLANLKNDSTALSRSLIAADGKPQEALVSLAALADHGKISPDLYKATQKRIDYQQKLQEDKAAQEKESIKNKVYAWIKENPQTPLSEMPPTLYHRLNNLGLQEPVKAYQASIANPDNVTTNWSVYSRFIANAADQKRVGNVNLETLRPLIKQNQLDDLAFIQEKSKDPKQHPWLTEFSRQMQGMEQMLGIDQPEQAENRGRFEGELLQAIRAEEIQKGKPLDFDEREQVIKRVVGQSKEWVTRLQERQNKKQISLKGSAEARQALEEQKRVLMPTLYPDASLPIKTDHVVSATPEEKHPAPITEHPVWKGTGNFLNDQIDGFIESLLLIGDLSASSYYDTMDQYAGLTGQEAVRTPSSQLLQAVNEEGPKKVLTDMVDGIIGIPGRIIENYRTGNVEGLTEDILGVLTMLDPKKLIRRKGRGNPSITKQHGASDNRAVKHAIEVENGGNNKSHIKEVSETETVDTRGTRNTGNSELLKRDLARQAGIPERIDLNKPENIWGMSHQDLITHFQLNGFNGKKGPPRARTSGNLQIFILDAHPNIAEVQFHPGGGEHGDHYYKFILRDRHTIKIIDPENYTVRGIEKNTTFFNQQGQKINYVDKKWHIIVE